MGSSVGLELVLVVVMVDDGDDGVDQLGKEMVPRCRGAWGQTGQGRAEIEACIKRLEGAAEMPKNKSSYWCCANRVVSLLLFSCRLSLDLCRFEPRGPTVIAEMDPLPRILHSTCHSVSLVVLHNGEARQRPELALPGSTVCRGQEGSPSKQHLSWRSPAGS